MMPIELKIILTIIILWVVTHCAAFPDTAFAKWGEKIFKSYATFLMTIASIYGVPLIITILYTIWTL
jgi:hypothetical protein